MGRITGRGIAVTLYDRTQTGADEFGAPTYAETPGVVENVLVGEPSTQDIIDEINLSGKQLAYTLAIPKGDDHVWTDRTVKFFDETFHTIGNPTQGIDELITLGWNKQVKVERYEQSED